jgi:hypothetical protein
MPPLRDTTSSRQNKGFINHAFLGIRIAQVLILATITGLTAYFIAVADQSQGPPTTLIMAVIFVSPTPLVAVSPPFNNEPS